MVVHASMVVMALALLMAVLQQPPQAAAEVTAESQAIVKENWHQINHRLSQVEVDGQRLDELLGPVMSHRFSISRQQLHRGVVYKGAGYRLRNFVRKLVKGDQPVKVGVVGGSITFLENDVSARGWWAKLARYLTKGFPQTQVLAKNGAVPGTPSGYALMCLELMVDADVDIVFIEYLLNDGFEDSIADNRLGRIYERLVRKILAKPNKPAVVMMQVTSHGQSFAPPNMRGFQNTPEETYGALAQYYDASWLSFRDAFWRLGNLHAEGYNASDFYTGDYIHPHGLGQRIMADLAIALIQDTVLDLLLFPWSQQDQAMLDEPIPEPMYKDNYETRNRLCLHNEDFRSAVVAASGFQFTNEGSAAKPKWGYVGTQAGATLTLRVNTTQDSGHPDQQVNVYLAYLKSYQHMGKADVSCESGCRCDSKQLDGHHADPTSQTYLLKLTASQSPACTIRVAIAQGAQTGEHKVKVSGLMIGTVSKAGVDYDYPEGTWGMEVWHQIAEEHRGNLTNATHFQPEEVHPQGMAAEEEQSLEEGEKSEEEVEEKSEEESEESEEESEESATAQAPKRLLLHELAAWVRRAWQ